MGTHVPIINPMQSSMTKLNQATARTEAAVKTPTYPSTPKQSRAWFDAHGIAITDWCETHGIDRYIVTDLLRGRLKGNRGEAHRAAILLGLKADPDSSMKLAA